MATKKYVSFNNLSKFFDNIKSMFATKTEVNAKSDIVHSHNISEISGLQTALDNKASSTHGTHVTYSATTPLMDGAASVGSAATVARSDHRHPIDTSRAAQTSLDTHTSNATSHITAAERTNWNTAYSHSQSAHAPSTAEPNQNAFSNVKIGDVTIAADIKTDTITLVAGNNITLTPDATNDKITIAAKDTTYSLSSFGITATAAELNKLDGVTATSTEINYIDGATSNIQNQLDGKAASSHTHKVANISDLTVTATELNYIDGVTSNIQTQLDGKAASGHTHNYAGSSSVGGAATSANKLNTNAGSSTQPVYFLNGVPVATTYTLGKSVPSNAVFTDTHYASKNVVGATNATSNTATALTNGNVYLNSVENGAVTSSHKISGSGATTVTTDANGNIVISSTDNNTTYGAAGSSLGLVKSGGDVSISSGVITVNDDSHNHTIANVDNLQASLDTKQATITGGASTITTSNLTANRALLSNGSGKVAVSDITSTEIGYLDGVTSNIQTQLDGKAASSHNHAASNITSGTLSSDRLPTVPITKGGTGATTASGALTNLGLTATATELNYVDGVTSNIQTQLNNKASSSHTHNYAGSSSVGGSATSAVKLDTNTAGDSNTPVYFSGGKPVACTSLDLNTTGSAAKLTTARSISLGNDLSGSANFDGSGNITISAKHYNVAVNSGNKSNYPYHRFAYKGSKTAPITGQYNDTDAIFHIRETYNGGGYGILKVSLRTNASTSTSQASATWLARYNFALDDVKIGLYNVAGATYADLYIKVGTYARTTVIQLEGNRSWTLVASNEVSDTTTTDPLTSTECYASIETAATTLHGQAYSTIVSSVDGGTVNYANSAGSATTATKLSSAKTISLTGDVTGSTSFDGSGNASITATIKDDSHNHIISNIDNLQSIIDAKSDNDHRHYPISITVTGEDLNNYTDAGFYVFAQAYAPTNAPSGNVNGWLLVIPWSQGNGTIKQLWFRHGTVGNNDFETYVRTKVGTNAWGSWSKYYTTSNPPTYAEVGASPAFTNSTGGVKFSYGSGSGKNVLTEISNMEQGVHTGYAISGTTGNPKTNESFRFLIHKTSATIGWILAWDAQGSLFTNYQSAADTFKGWKCVYDANPSALWTGGLYMSSSDGNPQTVKPSKKLSECRTGWVLVWSDYDADTSTRNNTDIHHDYVFKKNVAGANWSGQCMLCDIPRYVGSDPKDVDTERRIIKPIYIHDDRIEGSYQGSYDERNDVVLRAVYEF